MKNLYLKTLQRAAELKEQVTSPGGTTAAGLQVLEAAALRSILIQAVKAATLRSEARSGDVKPTHCRCARMAGVPHPGGPP